MEAFVFLLLVVIAVCFVLPLVAITKATAARRSVEDFETRLRSLEAELQMLKRTPAESAAEQPFAVEREAEEARGFVTPTVVQPSQIRPASVPPPLPEEVITACDICSAAGASSTARCQATSAEAFGAGDQLGAIHGRKTLRLDRRAGAVPRGGVFREILVRAQPHSRRNYAWRSVLRWGWLWS